MTRPEADDLFREYARSRDHAVMARLVEENLPLSQAVARKFQGRGVEKDDLEQVAAMALMQAIERFDPERGLQFSTFALPTIAGSVRNNLRDRGSTIRLTRSLREQLTKLRRVSDELTRKLQREPSMRELAEAMELPPEELLTLLDARRAAQTVSLDAETSDDAEAPRLETFLGRLTPCLCRWLPVIITWKPLFLLRRLLPVLWLSNRKGRRSRVSWEVFA